MTIEELLIEGKINYSQGWKLLNDLDIITVSGERVNLVRELNTRVRDVQLNPNSYDVVNSALTLVYQMRTTCEILTSLFMENANRHMSLNDLNEMITQMNLLTNELSSIRNNLNENKELSEVAMKMNYKLNKLLM